MIFLKNLKNKIRRKLALFILHDLKLLLNQIKEVDHIPYKNFKKYGKDSFFWGQNHTISGHSEIEIGQNVHINSNSFIKGDGGLSIGDNTHISRNLVLYTINHDFKGDSLPYNENIIKKPVSIGANVWIGMNVCITPGSQIGEGCVIGMGTVVSGIVPPLTIIGSEKWRSIGQRDKRHYEDLVKNKLYGGINGKLYNWSDKKTLDHEGDVYHSKRSETEILRIDNVLCVKKKFFPTDDGIKSAKTELEGYRLFENFDWCPQLYSSQNNELVIEYIPNVYRLDRLDLKGEKREELLKEILWCLIDIFNLGYAHCDFHAKNIFCTPEGVRITDFEALTKQDPETDFFKSYDVLGEGLDSPFSTKNMSIFHNSPFALASIFDIKTIDDLKQIIQQKFKDVALDASKSFHSKLRRENRALLRKENIYSSFNLLHFRISGRESQRDTQLRFEKFKIRREIICNKTVLDIGSNIGGILLNIAVYEPKIALGLEIDLDKVNFANKLARFNNINNIKFLREDVDQEDFHENFNKKYDVVFCLAVVEHLRNKDLLFSMLGKCCNDLLFFEGNSNTDKIYVEEQLKRNGFLQIAYLGLSCDEKAEMNNVRPMWIAKKKI